MRKLISLGLLAIFLSFVASPVFAGDVDECEKQLKGISSPGLYGLCVAYHNAGSSNAMDRILENYNKKKGPGDPDMPGTGESVPCPCWTVDQIATAICKADPFVYSSTGDPNIAVYLQLDPPGGGHVIFLASAADTSLTPFCSYQQFGFIGEADVNMGGSVNLEEGDVCRAGIATLVVMDFLTMGECPGP